MRRWAAFLVLLVACAGAPEVPIPRAVPTSDETRRQLHLVAGHDRPVSCVTAGRGVVVVRMRETFFEPACLTVAAGQRLRFVNAGNARHNVTIRAADVSLDVAPGKRRSFVPAAVAGPLDVFCRFHVSAGMTATITVA